MSAAPAILMVDDLEENLVALRAALGETGARLLDATSRPRGLERLLVEPDVALAILDVRMPGMDGFELAELMRGTERTRRIPIIFVTASTDDAQTCVFEGYEAGAVDFLVKPIELAILRSKAGVFLELHRQRKLLEEQQAELKETLRLHELFVAVLSHNLRAPLNAIGLTAELVPTAAAESERSALAGRILASTKRMSRMLDDMFLLTRARLAGGVTVARRTSVSVANTVQRVIDEHKSRAGALRVTLNVEGNAVVSADADSLARIFSNLVGNALRHGRPGDPVEVTIDGTSEAAVSVEVKNGGDLSPEVLARLFDPFTQGPRRSSSSEGLGLGLYIARQLARAHGGDIRASSAEGLVTFTVRLPRG